MSQLQRKILFPTAVYFKDILNAKELNKYLFKEIKSGVKQILKEKQRLTLVLVGTAKQIWISEKNTNPLSMSYLKWLTSVIKIMV